MSKENLVEKLPASLEIERKFLVKYLLENWDQYPHQEILQGYIEINEDGSEKRLRQVGNRYEMEEKAGKGKIRIVSPSKELSRDEFSALWLNTQDRIIEKTRYKIPSKELIFELDIYQGKHQGLIVVEVEFKSNQESLKFILPDWFGEEVTDDERYKNKNLAQSGLP